MNNHKRYVFMASEGDDPTRAEGLLRAASAFSIVDFFDRTFLVKAAQADVDQFAAAHPDWVINPEVLIPNPRHRLGIKPPKP